MKKIVILGASGHGKVVAEIAKLNGYDHIVFLDDNTSLTQCGVYSVVGTINDLDKYIFDGFDVIVAIGNASIRKVIQERISRQDALMSLIHPKACVSSDVTMGAGTVVMAGAVINTGTVIGKGCIINTGATVDHDNSLGDFVHISVGAHLAGGVTVGSGTWVGIGSAVSNNIEIGAGCMIGAGAVVIKDICEPGTYVGVPAKKVK